MDLPIQTWLRQNTVVNVSGTMTALGASRVPDEVTRCVADSLGRFVDMDALQAEASRVIAEATGSESGCVTACVASGICISLAAAMTGADLGKAEALPDSSRLDRTEVVVLKGHVVSYGSNITQKIRLTGATPVEVGTATAAEPYQLRHALSKATCAALWVVSHHTVQSGLLDLQSFIEHCHEQDVPVIVDAASEYDLKTFIRMGADVAIYSGHKFLSGPTSGIVAGRADLVRAAYLHQSSGIGRAMKAGKESVVGAVAALQRWEQLDHRQLHELEYQRLTQVREGLEGVRGLIVAEHADPTGNPITRLRVSVDASVSGLDTGELAKALRTEEPAIVVRDHHVDLGFFEIDPCNMREGDPETVVRRFQEQQSLFDNYPPEAQAADPLGPRHSRYDDDGLPGIHPKRVPFTYRRGPDREDQLKQWPEGYL